MSTDNQDVLGRFHRALVREIQATNPEHLSSPFSVAEIYQNLVPYRTHRDELEVEMNGDYEHALLRLLAGEGDFLTIESRTARQEIREELESPNPNTGLYRDFAAADVRLNPDKIDEALGWIEALQDAVEVLNFVPQQGFDAEDLRAVEDSPEEMEGVDEEKGGEEPEEEEEESDELQEGEADMVYDTESDGELDSQELPLEVSGQEDPSPADTGEEETEEEEAVEVFETEEESSESQGEDEGQSSGLENCPWCRENLPNRPGVSFCPFCGSNVRLVPCPACGEELELNWRFCVACGTEVAS